MRGFFCVLASLLLAWAPQGDWYIRVVARNDGAAARTEKLRVRDAALACCPASPEQLPPALPAIRSAVERIAPDAAVTLRSWAPPGRPARPTLYIALGAARGHNWWGLLYEDAARMAAEGETDGGEITFVWPWWEWLRGLLGF